MSTWAEIADEVRKYEAHLKTIMPNPFPDAANTPTSPPLVPASGLSSTQEVL